MIGAGIGLVGEGIVGVVPFHGVQFPSNVDKALRVKKSCYVDTRLSGMCQLGDGGFDLSSPWSKAMFKFPPKMTVPYKRGFRVLKSDWKNLVCPL